MPPRTAHSSRSNASTALPARPVPHPGGERSAPVSSRGADQPFILYDGFLPDELADYARRVLRDWPLSPEMEERMREEEMTSANPLVVAAIIFFVSIAAFTSGVIAGPAVRQLLAMVL